MQPFFISRGPPQLVGARLQKTLKAPRPKWLWNLVKVGLGRVLDPMSLIIVSDFRDALLEFRDLPGFGRVGSS